MNPNSQPPTPHRVLAQRLNGVSESATLKLNAAVQAMRAQGVDVVNLTAGEPDFHVPDEAKAAVIEALERNCSKYTAVAGIPELREAVAAKTNRQQPSVRAAGFPEWKGTDVVVSNGGKQSLFNVFMALLDPGDEVLIPAPYWLSYPEMVKLCGGVARFIPAPIGQGFKIRPEQLRAALTPRTRLLVLNSPSNPTGAMYSKAELAALGEVLSSPEGEQVWVVSDEIYDRLVYSTHPFCSFLEAAPRLAGRAITVNGMSKSAAMSGWRVGWSVAPSAVTQGILTLQGQSTSGINALAQYASVAALRMPEEKFRSQVESFRRRRDLALDILRNERRMELSVPDGAFYLFAGIGKFLREGKGGREDAVGFAERLLEGAKVATVPGTPFGEPGYLRLSFATDEKALSEGCHRIVKFLQES